MNYYAVIVAGGTGSRMGASVPKQFLLLKGKPVLMHTIQAFYESDFQPEIILVLNSVFHAHWQSLCTDHHFKIPYTLVEGGEQRFHSVKNSLKYIKAKALVAIHDGVRPLVSNQLITAGYLRAETEGNAICAVKAGDSIRRGSALRSETIDREEVFLVQTPQTFESDILKRAYEQPYRTTFTDDASVVEASGENIYMIEGDRRNIKITFPEDLLFAEILSHEADN